MTSTPIERKRNFLFSMLCGAGGFAIFSSTMSKTPVLPLFAEHLGAGPQIVGLIASAATVVGILTSAPAGFLSDYVGRKKIILSAGFVFASAPFLYYWIHAPWQLAALRIYHGFATAIFGPVAMALVADLFASKRAEKMGTYSSATLVGRFLAPLIGGAIIVRLGFKAVYLFCGVFGAIAFLLLFWLPNNPAERSSRSGDGFSWKAVREELRQLFGNVPLLSTSMCEAAMYFAFGAVETFFPLYAIKIGMNAQQVGVLFSVQIITIAFTKPLMGKLSDRHGRKAPIIGGLLFGAAGVACIAAFRNPVVLAAILIVFGLAMSTVTASTSAMVADLSPKKAHGSSLGLLSSIMDIGHASGPIVAGALVAAWGYETNYIVVAAIMTTVALLFPLFVRQIAAAPERA